MLNSFSLVYQCIMFRSLYKWNIKNTLNKGYNIPKVNITAASMQGFDKMILSERLVLDQECEGEFHWNVVVKQ